jgi:magnesium-protoporphyrin O-methyltransferase
MADCCNPSGYRHFFNEKEARRSLRRYEKRGLDKITRRLLDYVVSRGLQGRSILEVGGGIGAVQIELLKAGAAHAVNVELSGGYEGVATELLEREGLGDRVDRQLGDFTVVADDLIADDVFMNRVICCYPFMERLLGAALDSSRRFVAASFPRDHLGAKIAIVIGNTYCRLRNVDFRGFVHPVDAIIATAGSRGFEIAHQTQNLMWKGVVFERGV